MIADTTEELLAIAERLGLRSEWIQDSGAVYEHFDVCMSKLSVAVELGAVEVTARDLLRKIHERK